MLAGATGTGWFGGAQAQLALASHSESIESALQVWRGPQDGAPLQAPAEPEVAVHLPARQLIFPALHDRPAYTVYVPEGPDVPRRAVMVLHGMGGNGPGIAPFVLPYAQSQGWVVIAPTILYGDWKDPNQLTTEELRLLPQVDRLIDYVRDEAGVKLAGRMMMFGFSRGAQEALRFATLYPERVEAVAALSAGTYTVPVGSMRTASGETQAPLPYGVADLEQRTGRPVDLQRLRSVRFLIAVGARDDHEADVPRQWDPYIGKNRVERAQRYSAVLAELACETQLEVVPNAGHEIVAGMMEHVNGFLGISAERAHLREQAAAASAATGSNAPAAKAAPRSFRLSALGF